MASSGGDDGYGSTMVALVSCPGERSVKVFDYETGTTLFTFADTTPSRHGLSAIAGEGASEGLGSAGDYLVATQAKEQAIIIHKWGKAQPLFKCRTPEILGPVVVTPDGLYCLAGGASGRIYVWDVGSGSLLKTWEGHFKSVTAMAITSCGGVLLTGSDDTLVHAWMIGDALDEEASLDTQGVRPWRTWSDHSLPVTSLYCGQGGSLCRAVSSSLDHTVKLYDVFSGHLLHSVRCPVGLWGACLSPTEAHLFMAGGDGRIFVVDMDAVAMAKTASRATVHYAASGTASITTEGSSGEGASFNELVGHKKMVNSLRVTADGRFLLSASEDGTLRTWDVSNFQCIKKMTVETVSAMMQVLLVPRPVSLFQPVASKVPLAPLQPFKKFKTEASSLPSDRCVTMFLSKLTGSEGKGDELLNTGALLNVGEVVGSSDGGDVGEASSGAAAPPSVACSNSTGKGIMGKKKR